MLLTIDGMSAHMQHATITAVCSPGDQLVHKLSSSMPLAGFCTVGVHGQGLGGGQPQRDAVAGRGSPPSLLRADSESHCDMRCCTSTFLPGAPQIQLTAWRKLETACVLLHIQNAYILGQP